MIVVDQHLSHLLNLRLRKAQALYLYLLSTPGRIYRNEMIADLLWPESSAYNAALSLRQTLRKIRAATASITDFKIIMHAGTISAPSDTPDTFDAVLLRSLDQAQYAPDAIATVQAYLDILEKMLGISDPFDSWVQFLRTQILFSVVETLEQAYQNKDAENALRIARFVLTLEPYNENAVRVMMVSIAPVSASLWPMAGGRPQNVGLGSRRYFAMLWRPAKQLRTRWTFCTGCRHICATIY